MQFLELLPRLFILGYSAGIDSTKATNLYQPPNNALNQNPLMQKKLTAISYT